MTIDKGTSILLPVYGLHHDLKYHQDPDKFKPERFLEGNMMNYTFMPFGEGPRSCIGKRLGILQVKLGVAYILHNYEISLNERTKLPLEYEPNNALTAPLGGIWLNFKKINKKIQIN